MLQANLTACFATNIKLESASSPSTIKITFTRPTAAVAGQDQAPSIPVYDTTGRFVSGPSAGQWMRIDSRKEQVHMCFRTVLMLHIDIRNLDDIKST